MNSFEKIEEIAAIDPLREVKNDFLTLKNHIDSSIEEHNEALKQGHKEALELWKNLGKMKEKAMMLDHLFDELKDIKLNEKESTMLLNLYKEYVKVAISAGFDLNTESTYIENRLTDPYPYIISNIEQGFYAKDHTKNVSSTITEYAKNTGWGETTSRRKYVKISNNSRFLNQTVSTFNYLIPQTFDKPPPPRLKKKKINKETPPKKKPPRAVEAIQLSAPIPAKRTINKAEEKGERMRGIQNDIDAAGKRLSSRDKHTKIVLSQEVYDAVQKSIKNDNSTPKDRKWFRDNECIIVDGVYVLR